MHGAGALCQRLQQTLGPPGSALAGGRATWQKSPCLGQCEQAPAAWLVEAGEEPYGTILAPFADPTSWFDRIGEHREEGRDARTARLRRHVPQLAAAPEGLRLLRRLAAPEKPSLGAYLASGGYQALGMALEKGPAWVIAELNAAKLVGRGGAAFPAGRKWQAVAEGPAPRYVVCNADESEPGTFKDRFLLEEDPFAIVEAMTLAGFAVGAERGFLYVRGEYSLAVRRLGRRWPKRGRRAFGRRRPRRRLPFRARAAARRRRLHLRRRNRAVQLDRRQTRRAALEPPFPVQFGFSAGRP